ncbi:MAG: GntR family transcriptional regulator, partial [Streptosporangiaceae bacterium]
DRTRSDPAHQAGPRMGREFVTVMDDHRGRKGAPASDTDLVSRDLVRPSTLSALAKESILVRIVAGEIAVGQVFSAPVLAGVLGVSVTPVREALLELVAAGLVEPVPNKGYRVVELSQHDLDEICQLRLMLEVPAAAEVARLGTAGPGMARFRALADDIEQRAQEGDVPAFLEADREFHLGLLATLGNDRLTDIVSRLRYQARLYGLPGLAERGELTEYAREHRELLDAISRDDADSAAEIMTHHVQHTRGIWAGEPE